MAVGENESPLLCVKCLSGASMVEFKPLFSYDSRFLLVIAEKEIKVLSTKSGACVKTLTGHANRVISLQTNPSNHLQVLSCSTDGVVIKWNYEDGTLLSRVRLNDIAKVRCFFAPCKKWYVVQQKAQGDGHCLVELLPTGKVSEPFRLKTVVKDVLPYHNAIAFGMEGNLICCVKGKDLMVSYSPNNVFRKHTTRSKFTCITCHPRDCVVATGDVHGRIFVWANILQAKYPAHALYHWHALPVADLAFTQEGSFLYSGGGECVLVKWRLGSVDRQFIPRMGLPLCHVTASPDNSYVATSHTDNAIQLVSPQHYVVGVFQGLTQSSDTFPVGLLYDPRSRSLVLNGRPGHLQFYHPYQDKQLYNLDIVGQNYIAAPDDFKVHHMEVEKAGVNWDGTWLATVEHRDDGETSVEIRLKFWRFDKMEQVFCLNTNILLPHNKRINTVKFKPPSEERAEDDVSMLITTSADQKFKFWVLRRSEKNQAKGVLQESWMCHSLGYYHCHPAEGADFSEDGSLAAVAFGHVLTLWTTEVTAMKSASVNQHDGTFIRNVAFGRGPCCHLVVSQTLTSLTVWNVLSLTVSWNVETRITHLAVDPSSDVMAAFTVDKNLFVFRPSDPSPVFIHPSVVSESKILAAAFIPASSSDDDNKTSSPRLPWSSGCRLVFITSNRNLLTITCQTEEKKEPENISLTQNVSKTPFGLIVAQYQKAAAPEEAEETTRHLTRGLLGIKALNDILDVPSHVLPPVSSICGTFLSSLLVNQEKLETDQKTEENVIDEAKKEKIEDQTEDDLVLDLRSLRLESYNWLSKYLQQSRETDGTQSNVAVPTT